MTIEEKISEFGAAIAPDIAENDVMQTELMAAETMILNKMYPFGYPDGTEVPARYERLQIKLAVELYNQRGAEGQTSHSENGTTRMWGVSNIVSKIVPHCGSVITDA